MLQEVKQLLQLGSKNTQVTQRFVIDFEPAMWKAAPRVFPGIDIKGCCFHWCQCVWRKIQELGLVTSYKNDPGTFKLCRQLMALPYLPDKHITPVFEALW